MRLVENSNIYLIFLSTLGQDISIVTPKVTYTFKLIMDRIIARPYVLPPAGLYCILFLGKNVTLDENQMRVTISSIIVYSINSCVSPLKK